MHRQDAPFGHQVIHNGEDPLLHFTGILGAENNDFTIFKADINTGRGCHPRRISISRESTRVINDEVRLTKGFQLFVRRTNQHLMHK